MSKYSRIGIHIRKLPVLRLCKRGCSRAKSAELHHDQPDLQRALAFVIDHCR